MTLKQYNSTQSTVHEQRKITYTIEDIEEGAREGWMEVGEGGGGELTV